MTKTVDARGLSCPRPVMLTKKALDETDKAGLLVLVDNASAAENLRALGVSMNREVQINELPGGEFEVSFSTGREDENTGQPENEAYIVVLEGEEMGKGDPAFGKKLMEGYLYALTDQERLPKYVLCYNMGIMLTTVNPKAISDLKTLENKGVQVLSCGLCLDFYGKKEQLQVGQVTNMYRICELMRSFPVVKP